MAAEWAWLGAGTGGCFMMIGRAEGRGVPCSLSLISFIAMENSSLSIFPSLFISARALRERKRELKLFEIGRSRFYDWSVCECV